MGLPSYAMPGSVSALAGLSVGVNPPTNTDTGLYLFRRYRLFRAEPNARGLYSPQPVKVAHLPLSLLHPRHCAVHALGYSVVNVRFDLMYPS